MCRMSLWLGYEGPEVTPPEEWYPWSSRSRAQRDPAEAMHSPEASSWKSFVLWEWNWLLLGYQIYEDIKKNVCLANNAWGRERRKTRIIFFTDRVIWSNDPRLQRQKISLTGMFTSRGVMVMNHHSTDVWYMYQYIEVYKKQVTHTAPL